MRVAPGGARAAHVGLVAAAALATVGIGAGPALAAPAERPNIILIVTDDQTLDAYRPDVMRHTTRLLERRGTRFENAVVTTPLCCPARATILTGQYAHNHGVMRNEYGTLESKGNTLPVWLKRAGYKTLHVGRWLNFYEAVTPPHAVPPGWNKWRTLTAAPAYFNYRLEVGGRSVRYESRDSDYFTRVITDRATRLIRRHARKRAPYYMQLDHLAPHQAHDKRSLGCKKSPVPDPRDAKRFRKRQLPAKPSFDEADMSDKPSFMRDLEPLRPVEKRRITRRWRCSLASLRAVDRSVRDVVRAVKRSGEASRTVIAFTSDNGYYFGEHRIPNKKHSAYEEGIRVPLVIRLPASLRGKNPRPRVVSNPVANIDLAPTIVQLAGATPCRRPEVCRTMDGRSLLGLLRGKADGFPRDRNLVVELGRIGAPRDVGGRACAYQGLRTLGSSKVGTLYVEHTSAVDGSGGCEPVDERELYDLASDPFQLESVAARGSARRSPTEAALARRLSELRDCAGLAGRDPLPPSGHFCE